MKLKLVYIISDQMQILCLIARMATLRYQTASIWLKTEKKEKVTVQRNAMTPQDSSCFWTEVGILVSRIQTCVLSSRGPRGRMSFIVETFIEVFSLFIKLWHYHDCWVLGNRAIKRNGRDTARWCFFLPTPQLDTGVQKSHHHWVNNIFFELFRNPPCKI